MNSILNSSEALEELCKDPEIKLLEDGIASFIGGASISGMGGYAGYAIANAIKDGANTGLPQYENLNGTIASYLFIGAAAVGCVLVSGTIIVAGLAGVYNGAKTILNKVLPKKEDGAFHYGNKRITKHAFHFDNDFGMTISPIEDDAGTDYVFLNGGIVEDIKVYIGSTNPPFPEEKGNDTQGFEISGTYKEEKIHAYMPIHGKDAFYSHVKKMRNLKDFYLIGTVIDDIIRVNKIGPAIKTRDEAKAIFYQE